MGSPEIPTTKSFTKSSIIASITSPPQSIAFQDSPIFNYINNLSPIKPVKGTSVIQVYPGLSSPPLVFTSPRIQTHQKSTDLESSQCHESSSHLELAGQDDTGNITTGADLTPSGNSTLKYSENDLPKVSDSMNPEGSMENYDNEDKNGSNVLSPSVENDGKNCQNLLSNASDDYLSAQQQNDQRVAQRMQPVFENKERGTGIGSGGANEPVQSMMERHLKAGQSQLGKRRRLQFGGDQEQIIENVPDSENPSNTSANPKVVESSSADNPSTPHNIPNVSKPSGIGLHLNSIVNSSRPFSSAGEKKSISITTPIQDNMQCPSISSNSNLVENVSVRSEEYTHETTYSDAKSTKMIENQEKFDQGNMNSKQAERVDEFVRSNPKKKRKKTENSGDGCKNCNCKKSKCLKLYCDCFAAGIYCADSCSCQGCLNKPEYEETVLETRQQIESRNPLAFAPKIVRRLTQPAISQSVEDGDQVTPLAGRHKRGCNCKKSMCLKKYCECYQANVGCSDGCRCEGCQNIYGTKRVTGMIREMGMEVINENLNDSFDDKLKVGPISSRSSLPEFHKPHNLTPETPSFQYSNHGKDVSKARVFPGRYVTSPESECAFNPKDSSNFDMITKESSNKNLEMSQFDQDSYHNMEFMDEFSPGCTTVDWSNTSRTPLLPPSSASFSSFSFRGSSSVTPVTLFGGAKPSFDIIDDDTPNILKDSYILPNRMKVNSPQKKRVSPPRIRLHELGSSSLKSGRKFILKAVPSFPPLTPCFDSKETLNDPPGDNTL